MTAEKKSAFRRSGQVHYRNVTKCDISKELSMWEKGKVVASEFRGVKSEVVACTQARVSYNDGGGIMAIKSGHEKQNHLSKSADIRNRLS